jgi:hypothetical protein
LTYAYFASGSRTTENAYINANVVSVAAQVSGRVVAVHIKDNQQVKKGEALFDIDPEPFSTANFVLIFPLLLLIRTPKKSSVTTPPISAD